MRWEWFSPCRTQRHAGTPPQTQKIISGVINFSEIAIATPYYSVSSESDAWGLVAQLKSGIAPLSSTCACQPATHVSVCVHKI